MTRHQLYPVHVKETTFTIKLTCVVQWTTNLQDYFAQCMCGAIVKEEENTVTYWLRLQIRANPLLYHHRAFIGPLNYRYPEIRKYNVGTIPGMDLGGRV